MPHLFIWPVSVLFRWLDSLRFPHYQYRHLFLASLSPFIFTVVLFKFNSNSFTMLLVGHYFKKALIKFKFIEKSVFVISFTDRKAYFVEHIPYRLIVAMI